MKIEIATKAGDSNKAKGDLLENLSKKLLEAQGYDVIEEIRITGAELDLLCKHRVSSKEIYVECKAQKDNISAPILRQLLGTVTGFDYSEGWLISTAAFGKEAKGFTEMWNKKPVEQASKLSFYTPDIIIDSLVAASVIKLPPQIKAEEIAKGNDYLGEWTLLVSEIGMFWCVYTLKGGVPSGILVFNSKTGVHIDDNEILDNMSTLESSLSKFNFLVGAKSTLELKNTIVEKLPLVVEVQTGDSWQDYRPSRPQDFVGRDDVQKEILNFLSNSNLKNSSRVFAITGNSGLGKSSLIAKLRDRARNKHYRKKYYVYAVDIRGARSPSYIYSAVLNCLQKAQLEGFGEKIELKFTDPITPLNSPSINQYLNSLEKSNQVVCLVFDQFEELYSKPELFSIFEATKDLLLDVAGSKSNFTLGFAWKSDSTTHQDHPAYHMWHELADHRKEFKLNIFNNGEVQNSITTFEKEVLQKKIAIEIRHQITHSCQGFPWLLKKLCLNLLDASINENESDSRLINLDAGKIFDNDLNSLTTEEHRCLKLVAEKAPADWSEIIEISSVDTVNRLVHKRLIIKSGDRLNIYWDIFKDYLLTGKSPVIPFNYIPTTDGSSMLNICNLLAADKYISSAELGKVANLNEKTIWNIGADLVMLSLAERKGTDFKHHNDLTEYSEDMALSILRKKLSKHSLKLSLYEKYSGKTVSHDIIKEELKACSGSVKFGDKTWSTYTNRLTKLFLYCGLLVKAGSEYIVQDIGSPVADRITLASRGKQRGKVFSASVSPFAVCEAIEHLLISEATTSAIKRNVLSVLKRFELISFKDDKVILKKSSIEKYGSPTAAVWSLAKNEPAIRECVELIKRKPDCSTFEIGEEVSEIFNLTWSDGSKLKNGGILRQWSSWIRKGIETSTVPSPPGRPNKSLQGTQTSCAHEL